MYHAAHATIETHLAAMEHLSLDTLGANAHLPGFRKGTADRTITDGRSGGGYPASIDQFRAGERT